ncbi:MAG: hypothetical protein NZ531_06110 [Aquificaceae bacterium]|nr:hypothetical protein [Aquificaceae bacterium]
MLNDSLVASAGGIKHGILVPVNLVEKAGTYRFVLRVWDNHANLHKDHKVKPDLELNVSKNVEEIDLKIKDLDDSKEENPGAFICVNDDDDNRNRILDKNESGTVNNENELVSLRIFLRHRNPTSGTLTLESVSGGDKIKIWTDSKKGTEVVLPKTWQIGKDAVPNILYVEGISSSDSVRDVALQLRYTKDGTTQSELVADNGSEYNFNFSCCT